MRGHLRVREKCVLKQQVYYVNTTGQANGKLKTL